MVCRYNDGSDFKINKKSISIFIDLRPEYDVTAIQRIATNPNLLSIAEWRNSGAYGEIGKLLPSNYSSFGIHRTYNEATYYVDDRLVFLGYLRHAIGADLDAAITEHTANYPNYNSQENTTNDMYWIPELNLTTIYRLLPDNSPLLTPYQWVHSEHVDHVLRAINNFKKYNTGMTTANGASSLVFYVQSSLLYLEYIKYCLGSDLNVAIDNAVQKIIDIYSAE